MDGPVEWIASIGAIVAALMIAIDHSRKMTGYGFLLFVGVSVLWIYSGLTGGGMPLTAMNIVLLAINGWGVWRYLYNEPRKAVGPN
ncbi:hypothetical protein WJT74_06215 [Sphingomicrobium sp. XHP0239]|uniref:hypothetical protein n=1 Tax=Sphingomicrobium maritimum TaxID=3133972 RepID=UPI0031CC94DC